MSLAAHEVSTLRKRLIVFFPEKKNFSKVILTEGDQMAVNPNRTGNQTKKSHLYIINSSTFGGR